MTSQPDAPSAQQPEPFSHDVAGLQSIADGIRKRVLEHVLANNGGYMSQACSSAELLAALYGAVLKLAPVDPPLPARAFTSVPGPQNSAYKTGAEFHGAQAPDLDRFVISPAHYALVVYAALIEAGRLGDAALEHFNQDGSTVEMIGAEHSPGFETTTGSLSQALSQAGGIALARRLKGETGRTWVMLSDGEFQEGQTWEAFAALAFHQLSGLRVVADINGQQCDGAMRSVMGIEPLGERLRAFGVGVAEVDGHDLSALVAALQAPCDRPYVVLARTDPTRGMPELDDRAPLLHYLRFVDDQERERYVEAKSRRFP